MGEPLSEEERRREARMMASGLVSDEAREYMLEVVSCPERLGEDGMCDCARVHLGQLQELRSLFPDHCSRCEKRCLYAGQEAATGARRCPVCLLEDTRAALADALEIVDAHESLGNTVICGPLAQVQDRVRARREEDEDNA